MALTTEQLQIVVAVDAKRATVELETGLRKAQEGANQTATAAAKQLAERRLRYQVEAIEDETERRIALSQLAYQSELDSNQKLMDARLKANEITAEEYRDQMASVEAELQALRDKQIGSIQAQADARSIDAARRSAEERMRVERSYAEESARAQEELIRRREEYAIEAIESESGQRVARIEQWKRRELAANQDLLQARLRANDITAEDYEREMREAERSISALASRRVASVERSTALVGRLSGFFSVTAGNVMADVIQRVIFGLQQAAVGAFELGSSVEETASKFVTTFGPAAEVVDEFGESFFNMAGLTQREGREITATLGTIFQGFGVRGQMGRETLQGLADVAGGIQLTGEAAADASILAVQLAGDLASFNNADISEVLRNIQSGLVGEIEPMRKFGISLTDVSVKQRAMEQTGKASAEALTEQEKVVARLSLMYEMAGVQIGDLTRTMDSPANAARRLSARLRETAETISQLLLPSYALLLEIFDDVIGGNEGAIESFARLVSVGIFETVTAVSELVIVAGQAGRALAELAFSVGEAAGGAEGFGRIDLLEPIRMLVEEVEGMRDAFQFAAIGINDFLASAYALSAWSRQKLGMEERAAEERALAAGFRETADAIRTDREEQERSAQARAEATRKRREELDAMLKGLDALQADIQARREALQAIIDNAAALQDEKKAREELARLADRLRSEEQGSEPYAAELDALADLGERYPELINQIGRLAQGYLNLASAVDAKNRAEQAEQTAQEISQITQAIEEQRQRIAALDSSEAVAQIADAHARRLAEIEAEYEAQKAAIDSAYTYELDRIGLALAANEGRYQRQEITAEEYENARAIAMLDQERIGLEMEASLQEAAQRRIESIRQAEAQHRADQRAYAQELMSIEARVNEALGQGRLTTLRQQASFLEEQLEQHRGSVEERKQLELELLDTQAAILEQQVANVRHYTDAVTAILYDAIQSRRSISDTEIALQEERFEEEERRLRQSLTNREIDQQRFNLEMRRLAEERADYEKRVEADKAGFLERTIQGLTDLLIQEGLRRLSAFIAQQVAQAAFGTATAASIAAAVSASMQAIAASAGAAAGAVSIATFGAAAASGSAAAIAAIAAVQAAAVAASHATGFAEGGYTGRGGKNEPAGVVHKDEFVLTKRAVKGKPKPFYTLLRALEMGLSPDELELWLKERGYRYGGAALRAPRLRLAHELPGYAEGGYVDKAALSVAPVSGGPAGMDVSRLVSEVTAMRTELSAYQEQIAEGLKNPPALVAGRRDTLRMKRQTDEYERTRRISNPNRRRR